MNQSLDELIVAVIGTAFAILFTAFIFIKSSIDNKKRKKVMTEVFSKYGVKVNAKILGCKENYSYGRDGIIGKYNYYLVFEYDSIKNGSIHTTYTLPTNNPKSKEFTDEIPIIYIPAYLDYYNAYISREEFFAAIGHKLWLGNDCWLVIFAEDIGEITDLTEL